MKNLTHPEPDESNEDFVRRLADSRVTQGYLAPILPALVELYERVGALEERQRDREPGSRSR